MKHGPLTKSVDALIREQRAEPLYRHVFSVRGLLNLLAMLCVAGAAAVAGAGVCEIITLIHR